jgi:hypothetical protein
MNSWLPRDGAIIAVDHGTDHRNGPKFEDHHEMCTSATQDARAQLRTTTNALDDALRKIASAPAKKAGACSAGR